MLTMAAIQKDLHLMTLQVSINLKHQLVLYGAALMTQQVVQLSAIAEIRVTSWPMPRLQRNVLQTDNDFARKKNSWVMYVVELEVNVIARASGHQHGVRKMTKRYFQAMSLLSNLMLCNWILNLISNSRYWWNCCYFLYFRRFSGLYLHRFRCNNLWTWYRR